MVSLSQVSLICMHDMIDLVPFCFIQVTASHRVLQHPERQQHPIHTSSTFGAFTIVHHGRWGFAGLHPAGMIIDIDIDDDDDDDDDN